MTDDDDDEGIEIEDDDDNGDGADDGAAEETLAQRYAKEMRQVFLQKIELPIKALPMMSNDSLDLSPSFQRRGVWNDEKQSRFIESIIMNVPIPPVFLGENEYGQYVVLDGRQRLTAVIDYLENKYALRKLRAWHELNGLRINDLKAKGLDATITRRFVPAILLLKESTAELKYDVFDRLNTGGVIALPMEIRNAVYRGAFTETLKDLADSQDFRRLWGIPLDDAERERSSKLYQRMRDLELVLRFFALFDQTAFESERLAFKDYLSSYMKRRNAEYKAEPALAKVDSKLFSNAVHNCLQVFGDSAFVRGDKRSAPLADAIMAGLCRHDPAVIAPKRAELKRALNEARHEPTYEKALSRGTNGRGAIHERLNTAMKAVDGVLN
jgi:hypothetical protein